MRRPGDRLRAFAALWCDGQSMTLVVDPAIADLQREPSIANYVAVLKVFLWCRIRRLTTRELNAVDERTALRRTLMWTGGLIVVLTTLMLKRSDGMIKWPPFHLGPMRYVYLIPSSLAVTTTFGIALGVAAALGGRRFSRRAAALVLLLSLAFSAASFANLGWLTPAANQSFRVMVLRTNPAPDIPEMSLGELTQKIDLFSGPEFAQFGYLAALRFNYHIRWAVAFGPIVFTIFALSIAFASRNRWVPLIWALVACSLDWGAINANALRPWNSGLSPFLAAWTANAAVLCTAAGVLLVSALRRPDRHVPAAS